VWLCDIEGCCIVINKVQYTEFALLFVVRDEVDAKKKRSSDPVCMMNAYVDQTVKVHKLKHGCTSEVSTVTDFQHHLFCAELKATHFQANNLT